jgi:hypothetical protein
MFWLTLYLIAAYAAVLLLQFAVRLAWERKSGYRSVLLCVLWQLPLLPYVAIAMQTVCFGPTLRTYVRQAMRETGMLEGEPVTYRVMRVSPDRVVVYLTLRCGSSSGNDQAADLLTLRRTGSGWKLAEWATVWSDCGSAEGNTFPPFPEAREF